MNDKVRKKPSKQRRVMESLVRNLRKKHFRFPDIECPTCLARTLKEAAKEQRTAMIEQALIDHGDENLVKLAYPALAPLIQGELSQLAVGDDTDF